MTNRLIWLIIILIFLLLGIWYYFWVEKSFNKKQKNLENNKTSINNSNSLQKKITLNKIKKKKTTESLLSLSNEEKKELENKKILKIKQNIKKILKLNSIENIKISHFDWDKKLYLIEISKIFLNNNKKIINKLENNYIYDIKTRNLVKLDLNIKINYTKKINNITYFITEKWTFISQNNKIEYFPLFSDFVINKWNYIWIIKNSDKIRKNNFNFKNIYWDLIVLYNPKKAIKKILYKPDFGIKKILLENNNIVIESNNDEKYILEY